MSQIRTESIAVLAWRMIERKMSDGHLDQSDLTDFTIPGTRATPERNETYRQRTYRIACEEAVQLLNAAQESRIRLTD